MLTYGRKHNAFLGYFSLDNNGGFSTVRSRGVNFDLSNDLGPLTVKGDGRTYEARLDSMPLRQSTFISGKFKTKKDKWIQVKVPLKILSRVGGADSFQTKCWIHRLFDECLSCWQIKSQARLILRLSGFARMEKDRVNNKSCRKWCPSAKASDRNGSC